MKTTITATAIALLALPATAATMTVTGDYRSVDPAQSIAADGFTVSDIVQTQTITRHGGNVGYRSPFHGTDYYGTPYFFVPKLSTGTLTFDQPAQEFSALWGSADTYNTLTFFLGEEIQASFTGADLGDTDTVQALGHDYVTVSGLLFDRVEAYTFDSAFEFASVEAMPAPLPLPAAGFLLLAGLGALAWRARK